MTYQVIVATAVAAQTELTVLNMEFLSHFETFGAIPFATLSIAVALTILLSNAFNFIDGHDGVAAGISIFTILAIVPVYWPNLNNQIALLSIFIILPMLVFWVQNSGLIGRKLFLGDSGSLTLGYLICWMIIYQSNQPSASLPDNNHLSYFLWIIFIPCADAMAVLLHRVWVKKPIFHPDRSHLHHLLTNTGINSMSVMVLVLLLHATFIGSGWLVMQYIPQWSYLLLAIATLGYIVTTHRYRSRSIID